MTALLSLFTGSATIPFFGTIAAALIIGVGGFIGYQSVQHRAEVSGLNTQITALHTQIDDPNSGYIVQIGRANAATAQVRANLGTCQATVTDSNARLAALGAQAAARQAVAAKAQADLAASVGAAKQLVAQIAGFKPTANACADGEVILRSIGR